MKKIFVLVAFIGILNSKGQWNAEKDPYMTKSLSSEMIKSIKMQTTGGNISISSSPAGEQRLEVFVRANNSFVNTLSKEQISKRLEEDYDLSISVNDGKLTAIAKSKHENQDWRNALNISFRAYVPRQVATDLSTSGGNISLTGLDGDQEFRTSGGNLKLEKLSGKIKGRTSGGNIIVNDVKNDLDLWTSGGNIEAENAEGTIRLSTSGGNVKLRSLNGDIRAGTSGGKVKGEKIAGELQTHTSGGSVILSDISCSLEASTSGGSIDVEMAKTGKYITLNNSGGSIDLVVPKGGGLDLDLSGSRVKTNGLDNFSGKNEDDEVRGKLNNGGIPVKVRTSGTIHFSTR